MHKTHIFDQKDNVKKDFLSTYRPFFFRLLQETNNIFFLALTLLLLTPVISGATYLACESSLGTLALSKIKTT